MNNELNITEEQRIKKIIDENIEGIDRCFTKHMINDKSLEFSSKPLNIDDIDLTKPHGLLGKMCENMQALAARPLPLSYPLYGLQLLSLVSGTREGYENSKLSLFSIFIAESGSGKDLGQSYFSNIANQLKLSMYVYDKPRSDKDMIINLVDGSGTAIYLVDEVHGMFNSINSKQAQSYQAGIGDELLKMSTTNLYLLSGLHKREFKERAIKEISNCQKKIDKEVNQDKLEKLNKNLKRLEQSLDHIECGFPSPKVNFAGVSTPQNIDSLICENNINSGLAGRAIIIRNDDGRQPLTKVKCHDIELDVLQRLNNIKNGSYHPIKANEDAKQLLDYIRNYYDQEIYRNDTQLGALYSRIYERVKILASLLALETGEICALDCKYALGLCLRHVEDCSFLAIQSLSNSSLSVNPEQLTQEIISRILRFSKLSKVKGIYASLLKQKVAKVYKNGSRKKAMFDNLYENAFQSLIMMSKIELKGSIVFYTEEK
jgi:hypothetical protein